MLFDHDPSGDGAADTIVRGLSAYVSVPLRFERLALTREQVQRWELSTRETKEPDVRTKGWRAEGNDGSCELEAIHPDTFLALVVDAIKHYMPPKAMVRAIKAREKADREWLRDLADMEADD